MDAGRFAVFADEGVDYFSQLCESSKDYRVVDSNLMSIVVGTRWVEDVVEEGQGVGSVVIEFIAALISSGVESGVIQILGHVDFAFLHGLDELFESHHREVAVAGGEGYSEEGFDLIGRKLRNCGESLTDVVIGGSREGEGFDNGVFEFLFEFGPRGAKAFRLGAKSVVGRGRRDFGAATGLEVEGELRGSGQSFDFLAELFFEIGKGGVSSSVEIVESSLAELVVLGFRKFDFGR